MKFILTVRKITGGKTWQESYDMPELTTEESVEKWGLWIVNWFNSSRRDNTETARILVRVKIVGESTDHLWRKTGAMTQIHSRLGIFNTYQCENCNVTGKRFGLQHNIRIDSEFRAKKYRSCAPKIS